MGFARLKTEVVVAPSSAPVARTLVVEDDVNILNLLDAYLEKAGHQVVMASDGADGLELALSDRFDLCVFDVMLPRARGTDIAAAMRANGIDTPIVFLTALGTELDVLSGFDAGADDYVLKPFSPRELLVRIEAILRRTAIRTHNTKDRMSVGPVEINETALTCQVDGAPVDLTPHEFRILWQLMMSPNRVFERGVLISCLYGNAHAVSPKAIDVHVHHLRTKLGESAGAMIQTVRGFGYKLTPAIPD